MPRVRPRDGTNAMPRYAKVTVEAQRKLSARAKKVRQRMAATAASIRVDQLEQLWSGSASGHGSKRMVRLAAELCQAAGHSMA